jgi:WhiB family transcriptional regulator, redox-sensing transcriptional regulator
MFRPSDTPNCESTDSELFFVPDGHNTYPEIKSLKVICQACNVKTECLNYALKHNVLGYWGNTTEHQRTQLRKQLKITPIPLYLTYQ